MKTLVYEIDYYVALLCTQDFRNTRSPPTLATTQRHKKYKCKQGVHTLQQNNINLETCTSIMKHYTRWKKPFSFIMETSYKMEKAI